MAFVPQGFTDSLLCAQHCWNHQGHRQGQKMSLLSLGLGTSATVLPREDGEVVGKVGVLP